jgi:hypothetical protein
MHGLSKQESYAINTGFEQLFRVSLIPMAISQRFAGHSYYTGILVLEEME